jgi:hypothetical protein
MKNAFSLLLVVAAFVCLIVASIEMAAPWMSVFVALGWIVGIFICLAVYFTGVYLLR